VLDALLAPRRLGSILKNHATREGSRALPPMLEQFERLINVLRAKAPRAKVAFNSRPEDSGKAALRGLVK